MTLLLSHAGSRIGPWGPDANVRKKALARHDVALLSGVQQLKPKSLVMQSGDVTNVSRGNRCPSTSRP